MKKNILLLTAVISIFAFNLLFGQKILRYPRKYNIPSNENDLSPVTEKKDKTFANWIVYSPINGAKTYSEPSPSSAVKKQLEYMDYYYIIEEDEEFAHIYKDENVQGRDLSKDAIDFGWIHKRELLLWNKCLVTSKYNINKKALVVNTVETIKGQDIYDLNYVKFRSAPSKDAEFTGNKSQMFEYYYVYKTDIDSEGNEWYLLSTADFIASINDKEEILGWTRKNRLIDWDSRIAVEPNWKKEAQKERRNKQQLVFWADKESCLKYSASNNSISDSMKIWDKDSLKKRANGSLPRFPLLQNPKTTQYDNKKVKILKAGIIGDVKNREETIISAENFSKVIDKITKKLIKKKNVNVFFVIDATKSMQPYFGSVKNAITKFMVKVKEKNSNNKFNFAVGIYRDISEGEEKAFKVKEFGNTKDILKFLSNVAAKDVHNYTFTESMFDGIINSLYDSPVDADGTNFLIVIGDAGNHTKDKAENREKMEIIADLLNEYEYNFLSFQIHNSGTKQELEASAEFVNQFRKIGKLFGEKTNLEINVKGFENYEPKLINDGLNYRFEKNTSHRIFNIYGIEQGKSISAKKLEKELTDQLIGYDDFARNFIDFVRDKIYKRKEKMTDQDWGTFSPGYYYLLKNAGITDEEIKALEKNSYQMFVEGWGPIEVEGQKYPLMNKVLIFSQDELNRINVNMQNLFQFSTSEAFVRYIKSQAKTLLIVQRSDISINELLSQIIGLPVRSKLFEDITLKDINHLNEDDYFNLTKYLKIKQRKISKILKDKDFKYQFMPDVNRASVFYWIEEDVMP
ncbi:MAG: type VI secretion system protein TssR, partial [Candidatus Marinimicrobia bacterium]|nr:type VI secretion system protein TssR [Candidatus Neomarinimicrobiota bacterium]